MANDWFCQFLADMLDAEVERPDNVETTASGAALLAGLLVGTWNSLGELASIPRSARVFKPEMPDEARTLLRAGWHEALRRTRSVFPSHTL